MTPDIRLLPFAAADGATNMAADEALLESAAADGVASLRFYAWAEPTLSLGYFQPAAERLADARLAPLPWVRRSTGGAAIVHHHELTYAFALPAALLRPSDGPWVCRFHHLVSDLLAALGAASRLVLCGEEKKLGDVLCFLHQTPGDLTMAGSKVAGSAQRKWKGALLQHGSILLARSPHAPALPGAADLHPGAAADAAGLARSLAERFAHVLDTGLAESDWSPGERAAIARIRAEKYANPAWNEKR